MLVAITPIDEHTVEITGTTVATSLYVERDQFAEFRIGPTPAQYGDQPAGGGLIVEFHYQTAVGLRGYGWALVLRRLDEGVPLLRAVVTDRDKREHALPGITFTVDTNVPMGTPVRYCALGESDGIDKHMGYLIAVVGTGADDKKLGHETDAALEALHDGDGTASVMRRAGISTQGKNH